MLVLQSCSDPLRIVPGLSRETNATSDGVCNFSNMEVKQDVDVIEEVFMSINEEVNRGIKQEEIAGDINLPDIKSEPDEVSFACICLLLDIFYRCLGILFFFFLCQYSWPIENGLVVGSVLNGLVVGSVLNGLVGGSVLDGLVSM